jgi:integrase
VMNRSKNLIVKYFGESRPLRDITPGDCDGFIPWMKKHKYAEATAGRTMKHARQFFTAARRKRLIEENPFEDIKPGRMDNPDRLFFITREMTAKLIDAAPCSEWRAIIALARYGGLRCPSELLRLTWGDVDWDKGRVLVRASKTEHQANRGKRWIPLFPEMRPHLEALFDSAEAGQVHVINRYREDEQNLRTTFGKIIERAGLLPWPRLLQNLRATRETELAGEFPLHVVVSWIGNSEIVAAKHYLSVTDADFEKALKQGEKPTRQTTQTASEMARHEPSSDAE